MAKQNIYHQNTQPDLTSDLSFAMPSMIGPYRIESPLSKGGMSLLFLGSNPTTHEPLVLKIMSPKYVKNQEMIHQFLKEAEIISMTDHPNIIKLYGQGKWEKGLYIAMEFIQGVSLRQFILQKSLSLKKALEIILQVAYALLHLHTHGVIHRDLKPENILITESGNIKVIDFGIARLYSEELQPSLSHSNKLIGTPIYMSPEQKENPHKVTFVSDIYSLGIIAYELILGRLSHGVIHLALLPELLQSIIENCLQVNPKNRYQDIVDVIVEINQYLKSSEEKKQEPYKGAFDQLVQMSETFFEKKTPRFSQLDIGYAKQKGTFITPFFFDFYKILDSQYLFIMAEPVEKGLESIPFMAAFKGMVQVFIDQYQKEFHALTFVHKLNDLLIQGTYPSIALSILLLSPDLDRLLFISCGHTNAYHLSETNANFRTLVTPNGPIGIESYRPFLETADSWKSGDILLLPSMNAHQINQFDEIISDYVFLSAQAQSEKILSHISSKQTDTQERNSIIITLHRSF